MLGYTDCWWDRPPSRSPVRSGSLGVGSHHGARASHGPGLAMAGRLAGLIAHRDIAGNQAQALVQEAPWVLLVWLCWCNVPAGPRMVGVRWVWGRGDSFLCKAHLINSPKCLIRLGRDLLHHPRHTQPQSSAHWLPPAQ